jgi:hypothetical protein
MVLHRKPVIVDVRASRGMLLAKIGYTAKVLRSGQASELVRDCQMSAGRRWLVAGLLAGLLPILAVVILFALSVTMARQQQAAQVQGMRLNSTQRFAVEFADLWLTAGWVLGPVLISAGLALSGWCLVKAWARTDGAGHPRA